MSQKPATPQCTCRWFGDMDLGHAITEGCPIHAGPAESWTCTCATDKQNCMVHAPDPAGAYAGPAESLEHEIDKVRWGPGSRPASPTLDRDETPASKRLLERLATGLRRMRDGDLKGPSVQHMLEWVEQERATGRDETQAVAGPCEQDYWPKAEEILSKLVCYHKPQRKGDAGLYEQDRGYLAREMARASHTPLTGEQVKAIYLRYHNGSFTNWPAIAKTIAQESSGSKP